MSRVSVSAMTSTTASVSADTSPDLSKIDTSCSSRSMPALGKSPPWLWCLMCWPSRVGAHTHRPPMRRLIATADGLMPPTSVLSAIPP